jgi:hypothetical protein
LVNGETHSSPNLDVQRIDTQLLAPRGNVLRSQHGSVWGGLVTIRLDLHASCDTAQRLTAGQIGNVDEGVVEAREDAGYAENELA